MLVNVCVGSSVPNMAKKVKLLKGTIIRRSSIRLEKLQGRTDSMCASTGMSLHVMC